MPRPRFRFTVRRMMAGVGVVAVFLSVAVPFGRFYHSQQQRVALSLRLNAMVIGLRSSCPGSVSPDVWDEAVTWTQIIGPTNIYSTDHIPFHLRERLVDDLRERLKEPIGPDLIAWIGDNYAAITRGTSYERYVRAYRCQVIAPLLRDALVVRPQGIAPDAWDRAARETGDAIDAIIGTFGDGRSRATGNPQDRFPDDEQDRFLRSAAAILKRPVGREKLLAVWKEIAASGPSAKGYAESRLASIQRDLDDPGDGR